jgi:glutamine amidotransferase-like uncharacterized protein
MKYMDVQDFLKKNFFALLVYGGVLIATLTMQNAKIEANAKEIQDNKTQIVQYSVLVERVIVLEEARKNQDASILEIKADVKDIKKHFEIPD